MPVDLWCWNLDDPLGEPAESAVLSADERARATRLLTPALSARFVRARTGLRRVLARYVGQAPEALAFRTGAHGKPYLLTSDAPYFNLSHSEDRAALAVCWGFEVGIDIERVKPLREDVASFFSTRERQALAALEGEDGLLALYRCWTSKEAVLKALGAGLSLPIERYEVSVTARGPARLVSVDGDAEAARAWQLHSFRPAPSFLGTLAVPCAGRALEIRYPDPSALPSDRR